MALKDKINQKLNEWKADLEHFNLQLHLGAEEAKEEFEEQKSRLRKWLDATQEELGEFKGESQEKLHQLRTKMDELRVQAELGKAETKDRLEEQSTKISKGFNAMKHEVEEVIHENQEELSDLKEEAKVKMNAMHTQFDLLRLRMKLGSMEAKGNWEDIVDRAGKTVNNAKNKISDAAHESEDKFKAVRSELASSWKKIQDILKD